MTIFRAPLANSKGEVMLSMQATGVVPAQAVQFRGLWVTMNNLVCATNDTGQARKYVGGFALEDPSGLLLVTETAPASVPMDGINANAAGAVVKKEGAGSLIHQGVGMTVSAPGGPIVVNQDEPALTFWAGLEYQSNSGSIEATQERASEATYIDTDGARKVAAENWIRQEFQNGQPLGTLMELAITNKCTNYNANPDAALTNITKQGPGILIREDASQKLAESGLTRICNSGFAVKIDATAGSTIARIEGVTQNTNPHTVAAYIYCEKGGGNIGFINAPTQVFTENQRFELISLSGVPTSSSEVAAITASPGSVVYFVLNQMEEAPVVSSPIITQGVAASRATDFLSWPLTDPQGRNIFNQTEGMCVLIWCPSFSFSDRPALTAESKKLLDLDPSPDSDLLFYHKTAANEERFRSFQGSPPTADVTLMAALTAGQIYLIACRWGSSIYQTGYKNGGTWTWGTPVAYTSFISGSNLRLCPAVSAGFYDPMYGSHSKNVYLWSEDKGTAWLENFFSGVAN